MSVVELPLMESRSPSHDSHLLRPGAGVMKADGTLLVGVGKSSPDSASCSNSGSVIEGLPCIITRPSTTTPNERREVRAGDKDLRTPALVDHCGICASSLPDKSFPRTWRPFFPRGLYDKIPIMLTYRQDEM